LGSTRSRCGQGTEAEQRHAFFDAYVVLENWIELFVALPIDKLDRHDDQTQPL
jgi:hypothetical protein